MEQFSNNCNPPANGEEYMKRALSLASRAQGPVAPNPLVGAVVVRDGQLVGQGWHEGPGSDHAEVMALKQAGASSRGADLYVTLEPCRHQGRTPPCTRAIVAAGLKRVFFAVFDPNRQAGGGGLFLREAGLLVHQGLMAAQARKRNAPFFKWHEQGRPLVILKTAASLDGKIATQTGDSKWITSLQSRRLVHHLRARAEAVMVGRATALADDPLLTVRLKSFEKYRQPRRIVLDSRLSLPLSLKLFDPGSGGETVVVCASGGDPGKHRQLEQLGHQVWKLPGPNGRVDLEALLNRLGETGCQSLLVEAGGELAAALLGKPGLVDVIHYFLAPILIGGNRAPGILGGEGAVKISRARAVDLVSVRSSGPDIHITARPQGGWV